MNESVNLASLVVWGGFALAFIFIYMVLASQFESLKHPFTIMAFLRGGPEEEPGVLCRGIDLRVGHSAARFVMVAKSSR